MEKFLLVDKGIVFTRIAVVCENKLQQFYIYNNIEPDLTNTIIQGRVKDIVKNLQAVFIDYGEEKSGFLHMKHIPENYRKKLNQGMRLPVQIIRENVGEKGHKLTGFVNLPGEHVVCLPFEQNIALSKKIKNKEDRVRLKEYVLEASKGTYGFIVRTGALELTKEALQQEVIELSRRADKLRARAEVLEKGIVLQQDIPMEYNIAKELTKKEQVVIVTNDRETAGEFENRYGEAVEVKEYPSTENLINLYGVLKEYEELFKKKVWLKNGGNIVIEHTEAMTVVDVNSAKAVMKKNREKSIWDLNKHAIKEVLYQIVNRNISGIIVIDLVEMRDKEDRMRIYNYTKELINQLGDSRSTVYPMTELGLLQIARTKNYISLASHVYRECERCHTEASAYNINYLTYMIELKIRHLAATSGQKKIYVKCKKEIRSYLNEIKFIDEIKERYNIVCELVKQDESSKEMFNIIYHI